MKKVLELKQQLGKTDMYLIDLLQKGYFDTSLKILDAGCGMGRNMELFSQLGHEIHGIDQNEQVIKRLKLKIKETNSSINPMNVGVGEMGDLPFDDGEFDFVICNAVLHFAKDVNHFETMFTDLVRVLKSKGVLFLRFVSSHTIENLADKFNTTLLLADESTRFVVDKYWLENTLISKLNLTNLEAYKTVNIDGKRSMTTLVLRAK